MGGVQGTSPLVGFRGEALDARIQLLLLDGITLKGTGNAYALEGCVSALLDWLS